MAETSAEKYRDYLISFVVPRKCVQLPILNDDPWVGRIGRVISVHGPLFRLDPCNYDQPHERLNEPTEWYDIRKVHDVKIVPTLG